MNNYIQDDQDSCKTSELYDQGEVEIVQLTTSVKEILQFPEIEKIPDSSKNSEVDEVLSSLSFFFLIKFVRFFTLGRPEL